MIETDAIVVKLEDATAYVQAERKSSCSGCSESNCGTSMLANFLGLKAPIYRVRNEVGAKVGATWPSPWRALRRARSRHKARRAVQRA